MWSVALNLVLFLGCGYCCQPCPRKAENDKSDFSPEEMRDIINQNSVFLQRHLVETQKMSDLLQEISRTSKQVNSLLQDVLKSNIKTSETFSSLPDWTDMVLQISQTCSTHQNATLERLHQDVETMKNQLEVQSSGDLLKQQLENFTEKLTADITVGLQPFDCSDILASGKTDSGVYRIQPDSVQHVFCDMETEGGGWTVFLARQKQPRQENFFRPWADYKYGFGCPSTEYWLGNEILSKMTRIRNYTLRFEAKTEGAEDIWGEWKSFWIDSEAFRYTIHFTEFDVNGTVYNDYFEGYFSGHKFSTYDYDEDLSADNCATKFKGAWWYNDCKNIQPTGRYGEKSNEGLDFNYWSKYDLQERYADWLQFKIRPR